MPGEVRVKIKISSKNCDFVKSLKTSLSPDNLFLPSNMRIEEVFEARLAGECAYLIDLIVKDDVVYSLKRARSTVEEILALVKTLQKTLCTMKENCLEKS